MNTLIQKAVMIALLDQELDEIKGDLKDRRSVHLKKLHAELKEKMQPYRQRAKELTERAKEAKSIEMNDLIAELKALDNQEYNDIYWLNENEIIAKAIKRVKSKHIIPRQLIYICERCEVKDKERFDDVVTYQKMMLEIKMYGYVCDKCEEYFEQLYDNIGCNYRKYLRTEHWVEFSTQQKQNSPNCEKCGDSTQLHCHHKHYQTLFRERPQDVAILCKSCHQREYDEDQKEN